MKSNKHAAHHQKLKQMSAVEKKWLLKLGWYERAQNDPSNGVDR